MLYVRLLTSFDGLAGLTLCCSFLPKDDYERLGDNREALLKHFGVPIFVANRACTELNGYFGCRASYDNEKVTTCSKLAPPLSYIIY